MEARVKEFFRKTQARRTIRRAWSAALGQNKKQRKIITEDAMSRKARNRMTRETIPEGFSAPMAFVDLLPVVFFGLSAVKAGNLFHSGLFVAGAVVCLLSGVVKVG